MKMRSSFTKCPEPFVIKLFRFVILTLGVAIQLVFANITLWSKALE
jgi:hypothetical protein